MERDRGKERKEEKKKDKNKSEKKKSVQASFEKVQSLGGEGGRYNDEDYVGSWAYKFFSYWSLIQKPLHRTVICFQILRIP